jgi:hypothetical protein
VAWAIVQPVFAVIIFFTDIWSLRPFAVRRRCLSDLCLCSRADLDLLHGGGTPRRATGLVIDGKLVRKIYFHASLFLSPGC